MPSPIKNAAYSFNLKLIRADGGFQTNPTLASGDVKIIIDNGTSNNIDTLPSLLTNSTTTLNVDLLAAEMNGDIITIEFVDQTTPKEWLDVTIIIPTNINSIDDLNIADGIVEANIKEINDSGAAAIILEKMMATGKSGSVVSDGGNNTTQFKTDLPGSTDFYGDSTGGALLAFTSGDLTGQSKRITGFNSGTQVITVESAFSSTPDPGDGFITVGRIEV